MDKNIEKILDNLPCAVKHYFIRNKDKNITEIRVRAGFDIRLCADGKYIVVSDTVINEKQLFDIFYSFCSYTLPAYENQISNGFITLQGGHRLGIAGVYSKDTDGKNILKKLYSMNIRLAGFARWTIPDELLNTRKGFLIAGAPHSGKTTFIRSFCRINESSNIVICDERNEIYSPDINHDFIINMPKAVAIEQAVRTMNPDIIICDEIGNETETRAIINAVNNGAAFICSVHAHSIESLYLKPNIKALLSAQIFEKIVFLKNIDGVFFIKDIVNV